MKPYALAAGEGPAFSYGIPHVVKLGELSHNRGAAIFEYETKPGEEPGMHTHRTEDEVFYLLEGEITFHCDGNDFPLSKGGFVFLPMGMEHGYTIESEAARVLVMTFPPQTHQGGWGGYLADVEGQGEPVRA